MSNTILSNPVNKDIYREQWQWQEGEYTVTRSIQWSGPGCHNGCGVLFYTKDNKLVKVEGDPHNGFNQGALCMRCLNLVEAVNHPERLKWPLKRVGKRGENKWERITWEEAFSIIKEKVHAIQKEYGNEAIASAIGTGRNYWWQVPYGTFAAFQTPNQTGGFLSGDSCYSPRSSIVALMNGDYLLADMSQMLEQRYDSPEWQVPKCILIWGCNPVVSNPDGFFGHWIVEAMKRGSRLIVVDPRITWLAAKADYWLRVRPGTDAALAMAFLNVIIGEDLYDHEFVEKWTYGFEDLAESVREMTPKKASEICWIPEEKIIQAARFYATSKPAALHWGLAIDQQVSATPAGQALNALWTITGNVDIPGGNIVVRNAYEIELYSEEGYEENVPDDLREKRLGDDIFPMRATGISAMAHTDVVLQAIETGKPHPIKMFWMHGTNPIANMGAEAPRIYEALQKIDFNVVVDIFMTPTAVACADLVLPSAMGCERDSIRAWWWPLRAITKVTQYEECKGDEEILLELINIMNPSAAPGETVEEWMDYFLKYKSKADFTYEELKEAVIKWPKFEYRKHEKGLLRPDGQPGFNTPTGKIELRVDIMEAWGLSPVPYYEEPRESPYSTPELAKEYPLILTTGGRSWEFFHSEHRQQPTMRAFHPDPMVEMNPETAKELGLEEGDWVWIENQRGRCRQRVKFNKGLDVRVVHAEHGWWFPESEPTELYRVFDSNINNLTTQCDVGKSGYGAAYKCLLCKIYKVTEENSKVSPTEQVLKMGGFNYVRKNLEF